MTNVENILDFSSKIYLIIILLFDTLTCSFIVIIFYNGDTSCPHLKTLFCISVPGSISCWSLPLTASSSLILFGAAIYPAKYSWLLLFTDSIYIKSSEHVMVQTLTFIHTGSQASRIEQVLVVPPRQVRRKPVPRPLRSWNVGPILQLFPFPEKSWNLGVIILLLCSATKGNVW